MQETSKSGVLLYKNFRDSLIIDKYSPEFQKWRGKKLEQLRSENSEDAMTWNVFRSLNQINPSLWVPTVFKASFQKEFTYTLDTINLFLWKKLDPPVNLLVKEGKSEIDVIMETSDFIWFIEVKYKSDISLSTTYDAKRNQVIRNIDVGLNYASDKDFYFSLLILDDKYSPKGVSFIKEYSNSFEHVKRDLPHRIDFLNNLKGITLITWFDFYGIFENLMKVAESEYERFIAKQAVTWLKNKIIEDSGV